MHSLGFAQGIERARAWPLWCMHQHRRAATACAAVDMPAMYMLSRAQGPRGGGRIRRIRYSAAMYVFAQPAPHHGAAPARRQAVSHILKDIALDCAGSGSDACKRRHIAGTDSNLRQVAQT